MDTKFLTVTELSRRTNLPRTWIKAAAKRGEIPHIIHRGAMLFPADAAEDAILEIARQQRESEARHE